MELYSCVVAMAYSESLVNAKPTCCILSRAPIPGDGASKDAVSQANMAYRPSAVKSQLHDNFEPRFHKGIFSDT